MSKVLVIFVIATLLSCLQAKVTEEQCKQLPTKNKHCHLEYPTWQREPNVVRYIFDWSSQKCIQWHWWTDESRCPLPRDENNFASEQGCLNACTGWAK